MSQSIQAIYQNGLLRPLVPLDLPENSVLEINVRDVMENGSGTIQEIAEQVFRESSLISSIKFPNAKKLSDEERERLGRIFSGEKPLGDYIDEDREARG
jgi:predicted DNA-binding antitoxin AbrB/MazE fold protein